MTSDYHRDVAQAQQALTSARSKINHEIAGYPTPISGCDAQFNHLLAERQKVSDALRALETAVFVPTPRTPTEFAGVESR